MVTVSSPHFGLDFINPSFKRNNVVNHNAITMPDEMQIWLVFLKNISPQDILSQFSS